MKHLLITVLTGLILFSCKDGNGNGAPGYTHNELAKAFVQNLNLESDFNVTLTKKSTQEENFIVIYDPYSDSYDAINIDNYDPAQTNAGDYYYNNSQRGFFDLDVIPGHYETDYRYTSTGYEPYTYWESTTYRDRSSGLVFEKTQATPKNLAKVTAIKEVIELQKSAEFLSSEFGLSLDRGKEVARLASYWKKASKKAMSISEQDAFSTELLGFSITAGKRAVSDASQGNITTLEQLVDQAAAANSITPEHATKLMGKIFGL